MDLHMALTVAVAFPVQRRHVIYLLFYDGRLRGSAGQLSQSGSL